MTRHLANLLDAIWTLSMGLFLGLTGGLVLSVILTFRGAREIDASPGVEPFSDPRFWDASNDIVAGYIGQGLFTVGGIAALILLGVAVLACISQAAITRMNPTSVSGNSAISYMRWFLLFTCVAAMIAGTVITLEMNSLWPTLYEPKAPHNEYMNRGIRFDQLHQLSERIVATAWVCGLGSLAVSPWCRRIADPTVHKTQ